MSLLPVTHESHAAANKRSFLGTQRSRGEGAAFLILFIISLCAMASTVVAVPTNKSINVLSQQPTPVRMQRFHPRVTHSTALRAQKRPRNFPSDDIELNSILHFLSINPSNVLPEQAPGSPVSPDNILDFSITSSNVRTELESLMDVVDSSFPVTLFGYGNEISFTRLERVLEEMKVVPQSFDLKDRSDGPVLEDVMGRLTEGEEYPKLLLKGKSLGSAEQVIDMALNGQLVAKLREGGVEAHEGDPYVLRDIVGFW